MILQQVSQIQKGVFSLRSPKIIQMDCGSNDHPSP